MKTIKKTVSLLLALIICLGSVPMTTLASDDLVTEGAWTCQIENGSAVIYFADDTISGDVTIPSVVGGYKVTAIGRRAFKDVNNISSVTIPDSVTVIREDAFRSSSVTKINFGKNVSEIGNYAFAFCENLTSVTIPDSVKTIGDFAFTYCIGLTKLTIGKGVRSIGSNAFNSCTSLKDLTIKEGTTTIGNNAFSFCYELTSVALPDSVTDIDGHAFRGCNKLMAVTFGENLKTIGYSAFSGCDALTDVYFKGTTKQWQAVSIGSGNAKLTDAKSHILGDPIIPIIPGKPDTPSNPGTPDNPGSSDNGNNNPTACDCKCHSKGFKKFIFKLVLFFQKIFRKNQSCSCGALHYIIL